MSHTTPHVYRGFSVRFDELEPQGSITMSKATYAALEQLENGSEEFVSKRYQVKAKSKFASHEQHELDSTHVTEHDAKARAKTLKDAGYDTEIVPPVEPEPVAEVVPPTAEEWDAWTPEQKDAYLKLHPGTIVDGPPVAETVPAEERHD